MFENQYQSNQIITTTSYNDHPINIYYKQQAIGEIEKKKNSDTIKNVQATSVFYKHTAAKTRIIVHRGGAGSSKSYSVIQAMLQEFFRYPKAGLSYLFCRKYMPSMRTSVLPAVKEVCESFGMMGKIRQEKKDMNILYGDNCLHFAGLDDPEKVKSSSFSKIWMEEATEFNYTDFSQLKLRLRKPIPPEYQKFIRSQIVLTLNPVDEDHWIKQKLLVSEMDCTEIISTYKDNPALPLDYVKDLLELERKDLNFYRIYVLGEWGKLEHRIYTTWQVIDNFPNDCDAIFYGLDFGYNSPTALIKIGLKGKVVYEEEMFYKTEITLNDFADIYLPQLVKKTDRIYADSAEPDAIRTMKERGWNVKAGYKGKIKDGIDLIKSLEINILRNSTNLMKEKKTYSWRSDKNGVIYDEPIDYMDHLMDAERYAIVSYFGGKGGCRIRWI